MKILQLQFSLEILAASLHLVPLDVQNPFWHWSKRFESCHTQVQVVLSTARTSVKTKNWVKRKKESVGQSSLSSRRTSILTYPQWWRQLIFQHERCAVCFRNRMLCLSRKKERDESKAKSQYWWPVEEVTCRLISYSRSWELTATMWALSEWTLPLRNRNRRTKCDSANGSNRGKLVSRTAHLCS